MNKVINGGVRVILIMKGKPKLPNAARFKEARILRDGTAQRNLDKILRFLMRVFCANNCSQSLFCNFCFNCSFLPQTTTTVASTPCVVNVVYKECDLSLKHFHLVALQNFQ